MSDGMGREFAYLSSHANNRYFIPNWGKDMLIFFLVQIYADIYFCRLCSSLVTIKRRNTSITD